MQNRQDLDDDSLLYYAGLLSQQPRSATALRLLLSDYFEAPVEIEQFVGAWYHLDEDAQCCFEQGPADTRQLGVGAVVGDEIWEPQARVRIVLGPLPLSRYLDFLPTGSAYAPLRAITRLFSGSEIDFELQLILDRREAPHCELGAEGETAPLLGFLSWAKSKPIDRDPGRNNSAAFVRGNEDACQPQIIDWEVERYVAQSHGGRRRPVSGANALRHRSGTLPAEGAGCQPMAICRASCGIFEIDKSRLTGELTRGLDKLKTGNARTPALSPSLLKMLTEAWTLGSLDFGAAQIRTGFIVLALATSDELIRLMREVSKEFQKVQGEALRKDFAAIVAGSVEDASDRWRGGSGGRRGRRRRPGPRAARPRTWISTPST